MTVHSRVITLLMEHFGGTSADWPDDRLLSGIDSLAALDFVFAVEKDFGVSIRDELTWASVNVGDMVEWLENNQTKA